MRPAAYQHIHVHLPRQGREHVHVARRYDLLSMHRAYAYGAVVDDKGQWEVVILISLSSLRGHTGSLTSSNSPRTTCTSGAIPRR